MPATRPLTTLTLLCLLTSSTGCMSVKYSAQGAVDAGALKGQVHKTWQHSLFLGSIPVSSVQLDRFCPDTGVLHVRSFFGPVGMLASVFTLGVWTPSRVRVTCAAWPDQAGQTLASAPPAPWVGPLPEGYGPPPPAAWTDEAPLGIPAEGTYGPPADETDTIVIEGTDGARVIIVR